MPYLVIASTLVFELRDVDSKVYKFKSFTETLRKFPRFQSCF